MAAVVGLEILLVVGIIVFFVVNKIRNRIYYFRDRNIPYVPTFWPFGSSLKNAFLREHLAHAWGNIYNQLAPHKIGGFFVYNSPVLMIRDPEYVQRVYATDFSYFYDRGFSVDEKRNPLDGNLFFLEGEQWKKLRAKLSPVFTSAKLKWMFEQMKSSSDKFVNNFEKTIPLGQDVDLKEHLSCYTTDVIASCAFGIESNSVGDPESKLREIGRRFTAPSILGTFKIIARFAFPSFLKSLRMRTVHHEIEHFFVSLINQSFEHRLSTGYMRKDFVQLLLELREKGFVEDDGVADEGVVRESPEDGLTEKHLKLSDASLTAQLFVFFVAGFATTSSIMNALLYFLSRNEDCQEKVRQEVRAVLKKFGSFTYDAFREMQYFDNCIKETTRIIPPSAVIFRVCTKAYVFPDGTKVEKGTRVVLPVYSLHHDPEYFVEPMKFWPERFDLPITRGAFSPFGEGPKICIGKRFSELEIKLTIASLLNKYRFTPASPTADTSILNPRAFITSPLAPYEVKIQRLAQ